jgi:hypothetical protein
MRERYGASEGAPREHRAYNNHSSRGTEKESARCDNLILSISPINRGFGYVIMKGPLHLIDWGVKGIREDKNVASVEKIEALIGFYRPAAIVCENPADPTRRSFRIRDLLRDIDRLTVRKGLRSGLVRKSDVANFFSRHGAQTKCQRAQFLTKQFPELEAHLPPKRRIWMAEDPRMSIFEAVALALAFWYEPQRKQGERPS